MTKIGFFHDKNLSSRGEILSETDPVAKYTAAATYTEYVYVPPPVTVPSPTYWWKLDDSGYPLAEEMGTGKTLVQGDYAFTFGHTGIDGTCIYTPTGGNYAYNSTVAQDGDFSASMWVKLVSGGDVGYLLYMWSQTGNAGAWLYSYTSGANRFFKTKRAYENPPGFWNGFEIDGNTADLNDYGWHHVVITHDDSTGTLSLYVDGNLENSGTIPVYGALTFQNTRIALCSSYTNKTYCDDVRVWLGTVLSAPQVDLLYTSYGYGI